MEFYRTETTVGPGGTISIDHVPMEEGQKVSVSVEEVHVVDSQDWMRRFTEFAEYFGKLVEGRPVPSIESLRRESLYED